MSKYPGNIITTGADTGYSVFFDGTGDYLSIADNAALDMGASDFTVELWVYPTATPGATVGLYSKRSGNSAYGGVLIQLTNTLQPNAFATFDGSSWGITINSVTGTCALNTWNHIAFTRSGGTATLWLNGVSIGSDTTAAGTIPDNTSAVCIGAGAADGTTVVSACYISNVRAVKGTALYTAAFTPPTQLLNITNTSLLTCNSPAIVDQSSNPITITVNGNTAVSTFTPFAGYRAYNPALGAATPGIWTISDAMQAAQSRQWNMYDPYFKDTVLALRSGSTDGSQNNTFLDSSSNGFTITRNPTTGPNAITQGTFTPFSPTGWSVYTNSDRQSWVSISSASLALGTGDFEISFYMFYINGTYIMGTGNTNPGSWAFTSDGSWRRDNLAADFISGGAPARRWNKIRCVRVSGVTSLYVNDVLRGSLADTRNYTVSNLGIGNFTQGAGGSPNFASEVYISNLKIVKAGTTILDTFRNNRYVDNSPTPLTVTANANATFQPPFLLAFSPFDTNTAYSPALHGGSGYFDGTDDFLGVSQAVTNFYSALGDWEMEAWVYPRSFSGPQYSAPIFNFGSGATDDLLLRADVTSNVSTTINLYAIDSAGSPAIGASGTSSATNVLTLNSWAHVVANRISGVFNVWVNGTRVINLTGNTATQLRTTGTVFNIGKSYAGSPAGIWNGYISGVKIRTGTTSYSGATITVPTAPPTPTNASFLCNFTNAAIFDTTGKNVAETVGNAQASVSQKKYGPTAMYFDGTDDRVSIPSSPNLDFGSSNFTIECWAYNTAWDTDQNQLFERGRFTIGKSYRGWMKATQIVFEVNLSATATGAYTTITATITNNLNQWYHVAFVRQGSVFTIYRDGIALATTTSTAAVFTTTEALAVGGAADGNNNIMMNGYISDFRITRGIARYTGNFTPPTSRIQDQ